MQRKSDMHRLAAEFESTVGEIVETVSSASTEAGGFRLDPDRNRRTFPGVDRDGRGRFRGGFRDRGTFLIG